MHITTTLTKTGDKKRRRLALLSVAQYCPSVEEDCKTGEHPEGGEEFGEGAAFEIYLAENYDDIFEGANNTEVLCPLRHICNRGVESAHEYKGEDKKEHHKHCLLEGGGVVGDDQPKT